MIDKQKVYNKVRKHLLTQMERSEFPDPDCYNDPMCAYRTYDPKRKKVLKCAVGCLVPFRHYSPDMEGKNIRGDVVIPVLKESIRGYDPINDRDFLASLQGIHDWSEPHLWEAKLDLFARQYNLEVQS